MHINIFGIPRFSSKIGYHKIRHFIKVDEQKSDKSMKKIKINIITSGEQPCDLYTHYKQNISLLPVEEIVSHLFIMDITLSLIDQPEAKHVSSKTEDKTV